MSTILESPALPALAAGEKAQPAALQLDERQADIVYALAHEKYVTGQYEAAGRMFAFLLSQQPTSSRLLTALAATLQMTAHHVDAMQYYAMAIALTPDDPEPVLHMCECLIALRQRAAAADGLRHVLAICADTPEASNPVARRATALLEQIGKSVNTTKESI